MNDYSHEHAAMLPVMREAGSAVMHYFTRGGYQVAHKDPENPVTDADFAANRILLQAIRELFPHDALLSEETELPHSRAEMERERFLRQRVWVIDPIDGTREFIKGRPHFAISVGLVERGKAVLGFICNPAQDYLLSGGPGLGLFRNGNRFQPPIRPHFTPPETYPRIVVSQTELRQKKLGHLEAIYPDLSERAMGSIAYKLALVADGTYDLAISVKPKNEWDIAGGAALLAAQGLELWEGNFQPMLFNKQQTESWGLVAGSAEACSWYRGIPGRPTRDE